MQCLAWICLKTYLKNNIQSPFSQFPTNTIFGHPAFLAICGATKARTPPLPCPTWTLGRDVGDLGTCIGQWCFWMFLYVSGFRVITSLCSFEKLFPLWVHMPLITTLLDPSYGYTLSASKRVTHHALQSVQVKSRVVLIGCMQQHPFNPFPKHSLGSQPRPDLAIWNLLQVCWRIWFTCSDPDERQVNIYIQICCRMQNAWHSHPKASNRGLLYVFIHIPIFRIYMCIYIYYCIYILYCIYIYYIVYIYVYIYKY